jgi:hypothetical protein|tara:strand:+ start:294 stop:593 length:300 start_codon:yes stop_codon:yes gene_type:complete
MGRTTPNRVTKQIKQAFADLVEGNLDSMNRWLQQTAQEDPKAAIELMIKLSERFVPALSRTELTAQDGEDLFKSLKFKFGPAIDSPLRINEDNFEDIDI